MKLLLLVVAGLAACGAAEARQRGPLASAAVNDSSESAITVTRNEEVRVVYFTGDVSIVDTTSSVPVSFGMLVNIDLQVAIGRGATVQFAVDGKLAEFARPGRINWSDIVRRATGEPNEELMSALRVIAAQHSSMASSSTNPARIHAAVAAAIDPSMRVAGSSSTGIIIPLEPRSTAVTRGPLHFRWLRSEDSATYRVIVRNRYDEEVLRHETTDTSFVFESAMLLVGSEYSWSIASVSDSDHAVTSVFHRIDDLRGMRLEGGESRIRMALGSENPALPIMLGAHFALHGCAGDAARQFTTAALRTPEHFDRLLRLAREQYTSMGLSSAELEHVQTLGAMTMN